MTGERLVSAVRARGAHLRLGTNGEPEIAGAERLPSELVTALGAQSGSIVAALEREAVDLSPLPWRHHGSGYVAILGAGPDSDPARMHLHRTLRAWVLTSRACATRPLITIAARGSLREVLAAADAEAGQLPELVAAS